jgi:hypothetical protein
MIASVIENHAEKPLPHSLNALPKFQSILQLTNPVVFVAFAADYNIITT